MTVAELLERMSSRELTEWMAYYRLEPFGDERADLRNALLCTVMVNLWSKKKAKIQDYMLDFDKQPMTQEELRKKLMSMSRRKK